MENYSSSSNSSKHKLNFLGKKTYYQWIYGLMLLLVLNSINAYVSIEIKKFIDPL